MKSETYMDKFGGLNLPAEPEIPGKPKEPPFVEPFKPDIFPEELPVINPPQKPDPAPPETPILPPK